MLKLLFLLFPLTAFAAGDINTTAEILSRPSGIDVTCARQEFQNALDESAKNGIDNGTINPEIDSEYDMKNWIYTVFQDPVTLGAVLSCPEFTSGDIKDTETLRFESIGYTFPNGREIVINYETQPKVLQQRFQLATKTELPSNDPNPEVSELDPHATWTYTDPAWYGIMVVQSGALRDFVGPNKNNVVSAHYIYDNIDNLYPKDMAIGGVCSTRTGMGAKVDNSMVHKVLREHTAKHPKDNNNYYVYGNRNLKWISYLEVVATIVLSIVSEGGYAAAVIASRYAQAARVLKTSSKSIKSLMQFKEVEEYFRKSLKLAQLTKEADNINDMRKTMTAIATMEKRLEGLTKGTKEYATLEKELAQLKKVKDANMWKFGKSSVSTTRTMSRSQAKALTDIDRQISKINSINVSKRTAQNRKDLIKLNQERNRILNQIGTKDPAEIARLQQSALNGSAETAFTELSQLDDLEKLNAQQINELKNTMAQLAKEDKNVAEYVRQFDNIKKVSALTKEFKAFKNARTGNVFVRTWQGARNFVKSYRTAAKSGKVLNKAARTARHGVKSGRVRDWLFHSTMKNAGRIAKAGADLAALYFVIGLVGDFFDYTSTENDEYTNGINLKPWLLLGADDIEGEDNVVNYGTWLRWTGDSTDPRDDDAAFLQAMDFAQKFHQDLLDVQEEENRAPCDVDIYVVRPIIRNPDREHQALYWLFMNDTPWTTATK